MHVFVTENLKESIGFASQMATRKNHDLLLPEHILLALLSNPSSHSNEQKQIINSIEYCGVDPENVKNAIDSYLQDTFQFHPSTKQNVLIPSQGVAFIINASFNLAKSQNRHNSSSVDFWIAFLEHSQLDGSTILKQLGVDTLKVKQFLSNRPSTPHKKTSETQTPEHQVLSAFGVNLTEMAKDGLLDSVIGRDTEIQSLSFDLLRRRKKNILLVGDPGVGKTAVVEGLAHQIYNGKFPSLANKRIWSITPSSIVAGTKYRGEFEERMKNIISIAEKHSDVILFIDEIHTIIGMGAGSSGNMDASNILKPSLARGTIQLIGATTDSESRTIIEKDKALRRRFVKRTINEPTPEIAVLMIKSGVKALSKHHNVKFSSDIANTAVSLAQQYIRDLRLPDSALDILDHLGSRNQNTKKTLTSKDLTESLSSMISTPITLNIAKKPITSIKEYLNSVIFEQSEAVNSLYKGIVVAQAGLGNPTQPLGSFLFTGPTGVGKTALASEMASYLNIPLLRFDMSEFQESHSISKLIGSPPGYVGHDTGGQLTAMIQKTPSCVLLLDEFEKSSPNIHQLFLQILDHGTLTDSKGENFDFRKCFIIFTTNIGAATLTTRSIGFTAGEPKFDPSESIKGVFTPELRNRISSIVKLNPLSSDGWPLIVEKQLSAIQNQIIDRVILQYDEDFCKQISLKGIDPLLGARPLDRWLTEHIRMPISEFILSNPSKTPQTISLSWDSTCQKVKIN